MSEEKFNFRESVMDHLEIAFRTIMMALGDEQLAYKILTDVCMEFRVLHFNNLRKIREQRNAEYKKGRKSKRKAAGRRIYHPTGSYLFYYLVKERIAQEERKQEILGIPLSNQAILFRYFHSLFENNNLLKGAFLPITAMYGILHDVDPRILVRISSHFHGIDADTDTKERDYRGPAFFSKTGGDLLINSSHRFGKTGFFEMVRPDEQASLHREIKESLNGDLDTVIKLEPADEKTISILQNILEHLTPWGAPRLSPDDIPKYDLNNTRIPAFESRNSAARERELETIRSATSMSLPFAKEILANESVRKNNMSDKIYAPVLNKQRDLLKDFHENYEFDKNFALQVALKQLESPMTPENLDSFVLVVDADGEEIGSVDSRTGKAKLQVPAETRKLAVLAKRLRKNNSEETFPLMVVPMAFTGLDSGEPWLGESTLDNSYHLSLDLTPILDTSRREPEGRRARIKSFELVLDYHQPEKCEVDAKTGLLKKLAARLAGIRKWVQPDIVSKPVEGFLHNLEATKYFSGSNAKRNGVKNSLTFSLAANGITLLLALGLHLTRDRFPEFMLIPETIMIVTIFAVTLFLMTASLSFKRDGINKVFSFCNHFSFLSGLVSIVILTSMFAKVSSVEGSLAREVQGPSMLSGADLRWPADVSQNKASVSPAAILAGGSGPDPEKLNANTITRGVIQEVRVNIPKVMVKYVSDEINISEVKSGYPIKAYVSDSKNSADKEANSRTDKASQGFATSLNATITSVDRETTGGNAVVLKVKVDTFEWKDASIKPFNDKELTIVFFDGDPKLSQVAFFMREGLVLSAEPFKDPEQRAPGVEPSDVQNAPNTVDEKELDTEKNLKRRAEDSIINSGGETEAARTSIRAGETD